MFLFFLISWHSLSGLCWRITLEVYADAKEEECSVEALEEHFREFMARAEKSPVGPMFAVH